MKELKPEWDESIPTTRVEIPNELNDRIGDVAAIEVNDNWVGVFTVDSHDRSDAPELVRLSTHVADSVGYPVEKRVLQTLDLSVTIDPDVSLDDIDPCDRIVLRSSVPSDTVNPSHLESKIINSLTDCCKIDGVEFELVETVPARTDGVRVTSHTDIEILDSTDSDPDRSEDGPEPSAPVVSADGTAGPVQDRRSESESTTGQPMDEATNKTPERRETTGDPEQTDTAPSDSEDETAAPILGSERVATSRSEPDTGTTTETQPNAEQPLDTSDAPHGEDDGPASFLDGYKCDSLSGVGDDDIVRVDSGYRGFGLLTDSGEVLIASDGLIERSIPSEDVVDLAIGNYNWVITESQLQRYVSGTSTKTIDIDDPRYVETIADESLVVVVSGAGNVHFYDEKTLKQQNTFPLPEPVDLTDAVVVGGYAALAIGSGDHLYWYLIEEELKGLRRVFDAGIRSVAHLSDALVVATTEMVQSVALDDADEVRWTNRTVPDQLSQRGMESVIGVVDSTAMVFNADGNAPLTGITDVQRVFQSPHRTQLCVLDTTCRTYTYPDEMTVTIESSAVPAIDPSVDISVKSQSETALDRTLRARIRSKEVMSDSTRISLSPAEERSMTLPLPSAQRGDDTMEVVVETGRGDELTSETVPIEYDEASVDITGQLDRIESEITAVITVAVSETAIEDVLVDGEHVADRIEPGTDIETTLRRTTKPGDTVSTTVSFRDESGRREQEWCTDVPESPLKTDVDITHMQTRSTISIWLQNQTDATVSETVWGRTSVLPDDVAIDCTIDPHERICISIPSVTNKYQTIKLRLKGENSTFKQFSHQFDGLTPVSIDRSVKQPPAAQIEATEALPVGSEITDELVVHNRSDRVLDELRVKTDDNRSESVTLDPDDSIRFERSVCLLSKDQTLSEWQVVTGDSSLSTSTEARETVLGIVLFSWIELSPSGGSIKAIIKNETDDDVIVNELLLTEPRRSIPVNANRIEPGGQTYCVTQFSIDDCQKILQDIPPRITAELQQLGTQPTECSSLVAVGPAPQSTFFGVRNEPYRDVAMIQNNSEYTITDISVSAVEAPDSLDCPDSCKPNQSFSLPYQSEQKTIDITGDISTVSFSEQIKLGPKRASTVPDEADDSGAPDWVPSILSSGIRVGDDSTE